MTVLKICIDQVLWPEHTVSHSPGAELCTCLCVIKCPNGARCCDYIHEVLDFSLGQMTSRCLVVVLEADRVLLPHFIHLFYQHCCRKSGFLRKLWTLSCLNILWSPRDQMRKQLINMLNGHQVVRGMYCNLPKWQMTFRFFCHSLKKQMVKQGKYLHKLLWEKSSTSVETRRMKLQWGQNSATTSTRDFSFQLEYEIIWISYKNAYFTPKGPDRESYLKPFFFSKARVRTNCISSQPSSSDIHEVRCLWKGAQMTKPLPGTVCSPGWRLTRGTKISAAVPKDWWAE